MLDILNPQKRHDIGKHARFKLQRTQRRHEQKHHDQNGHHLHHQVRNITGTLALVGAGKWSADDVSAALAARDRSAAGPTAPAEGLYLSHVSYADISWS